MKKIISILTLAVVVAATSVWPVKSQGSLAPSSGYLTWTNLASQDSNMIGILTIDCRRQQNVALEWSYFASGVGVSNVGIRFFGSVDGSTIAGNTNWTAGGALTGSYTPALSDGFVMVGPTGGVTNHTVITNFNVKGYPYLVLAVSSNSLNAVTYTNRLRYWVKPSAP